MAQQEANKRARERVVRALKGIVDCLDGMASEDRHRQDSGWQSWGDSKWADDLITLPAVLDRATRRRIGELRAAAISAFTDLLLHRILADTQRVGVQLRADPPKRPLADARLHAEQVAADLEELACEIEGGSEPVIAGDQVIDDGPEHPSVARDRVEQAARTLARELGFRASIIAQAITAAWFGSTEGAIPTHGSLEIAERSALGRAFEKAVLIKASSSPLRVALPLSIRSRIAELIAATPIR
ncbi:MAG: hypothetical protein U1F36_17065 [Planctomycetota bacterium]